MKTTISNLIRGIIGGILLILFIIPATGNAQNIFEQHGTLHKLIGFPSFTKNTGWIGGSVLSVGAYVEFGFSVGGNIGEVSLNGNGVLSKNGSNWDLWFQGTTGLAKMNFGFQTVAQYKVTVLGYTYCTRLANTAGKVNLWLWRGDKDNAAETTWWDVRHGKSG